MKSNDKERKEFKVLYGRKSLITLQENYKYPAITS